MKDPLDLQDLLGLLVRGGQLVPLDLLDLLADQALRAHLDQLERRAFLVRKALLAQQVGTEFRVLWVCPDLPDLPVFPARTEIRVRLESTVRKVLREQKESMVLLVPPGRWVLSVSLVQLALMESWDRGGSRALLELKVMREPEDSQEHQDPSDSRGCQDHQVRRERPEM